MLIITDILLGGDGHTKVIITDIIAPLYIRLYIRYDMIHSNSPQEKKPIETGTKVVPAALSQSADSLEICHCIITSELNLFCY